MTTHCTSSSDEDSTALEGELDNIDDAGETMADDIEELAEVAEEDLEDIVESEDSLDADDEVAANDEDDEEEEFSDDDEEFEEEDIDEDVEEIAENDEGFSDEEIDEDDFAEFDEIDEEMAGEDVIDQSEEGLAQELNASGDYPVAQNAEPQFPEEVMNAQGTPPVQPAPVSPVITSDTQEVSLASDPVEPLLPQDDLGDPDPIIEPDEDDGPEAPSWIPVVKIKTDPHYKNGQLMNAVYIARPGDNDMKTISDKIYNEDRVAELNKNNTHLAKGIDPGDKVYYNSPNRPEDNSVLKVYYADIGLPPQYYTTAANDAAHCSCVRGCAGGR